jgi:hypothetical protein
MMTAAMSPVRPTAAIAREIARGGLAGLIAGVLVGGLGGRAVMRISALIDSSAAGFTTENGATVNEFTLEGTIGLIVFGGIFAGLLVAFIWVIFQRWLPHRRLTRYAAATVVGVSLGGRAAIDGSNFDFRILDPPLVHAALFALLAGATATATLWFDRKLERRLPHESRGAYWLIVVAGLAFATPLMLSFFREEDCGCLTPPRLVGVLLAVLGILTVISWVFEARGRTQARWLHRTGTVVAMAVVTAGLAHLFGEIAHFA